MKLMKYFFAVTLAMSLLTVTNVCIAQTVYPYFSELRGMETSSGKTILTCRISDSKKDGIILSENQSVYFLDAESKAERLFNRGYLYSDIYGTNNTTIGDLQFWGNDTSKYIYSAAGASLQGAVKKYNAYCKVQGGLWPTTIFISKNDASVLFTSDGGRHITGISTDAGLNWQIDSVIQGGIVGLSALSDSTFFIYRYPKLYKTVDFGRTMYAVDSMTYISFVNTSGNGKFVFRVEYNPPNRVFISNNYGEPGSWILLDTTSSKICVSNDDVLQKFYVGYGKTIQVYDYSGNLLNESYSVKKNILGLYKKPGSEKLFVASQYEIDEITPQVVTIIKKIPVSPDFAQWHPLTVGNIWVYGEQWHDWQGDHTGTNTIAVTGDTLFPDGKFYYKVYSNYTTEFHRYDTLSGKFYKRTDSTETVIDETYIDSGDTLPQVYTFVGPQPQKDVHIQNEGTMTFSAISYPYRDFYSVDNFGDIITYRLAKGVGLSKYIQNMDFVTTIGELKACRINGVGYGDVSLLGAADNGVNTVRQFALEQNYPNPFNPSTAIRYSIPNAGQVKLNVYSVTGKLVVSLVNEFKPAGNYSVNFNAANLPSGVYFYRLTSGSFVENKKMILLK